MKKFNVGDKVISNESDKSKGLTGFIEKIGDYDYLVRFPGFDGHTGGGASKSRECWNLLEDKLELSEKTKFKVGDKVRINQKEKEDGKYGVTKIGSEGVIVERRGDGSRYLIDFYKLTGGSDKGGKFDIDSEYLELIEENSVGGFKVGDTVRAIDESYNWGEVSKGDVGVIESITEDGTIHVDFPSQGNWECKMKDLELAEKTEFQIGDKVECIKGICKGDIGIISKIDGDYVYSEDWSDGTGGHLEKSKLKIISKKDEGKEEFEKTVKYTSGLAGLEYSCVFTDEFLPAESKIKKMLNNIPRTLKRILSPDLRKQYKAGLINGDLELTERGRVEMLDILSQQEEVQAGLTKYAEEIISKVEKEEKKA